MLVRSLLSFMLRGSGREGIGGRKNRKKKGFMLVEWLK
jgi:hypothetical protein